MDTQHITRHNLIQAVDSALAQCKTELDQMVAQGGNQASVRDLGFALQSLDLIYSELHGGVQRPRGQRSAMFTRYVIDEEPQMAMNPELKDRIVQIEDAYSRY